MSSNKRLPDNLAGVSDLFFNYEHPNWDAAKKNDDAGDLELQDALLQDANDFLGTFGIALSGLGADPEELPSDTALVDDFFARL